MLPSAPFVQGEKPMFYAPIKHWVFDQSERAQGPVIYFINSNTMESVSSS